MEFENVSKQICFHFDPNFNIAYGDIRQITKRILEKYPNIEKTEVQTDYQTLHHLDNWKVIKDNPDSKDHVAGLTWRDDYDNLSIKHSRCPFGNTRKCY